MVTDFKSFKIKSQKPDDILNVHLMTIYKWMFESEHNWGPLHCYVWIISYSLSQVTMREYKQVDTQYYILLSLYTAAHASLHVSKKFTNVLPYYFPV